MKVWLVGTENDFDYLTFKNEKELERFTDYQFDGNKIINSWTPLKLELFKGEKRSDAPYLSPGVLVVSKKTIEVFSDLLEGAVEYLPVECDNMDYYLINVVNIVDCIDYERSEVKRFSSSGRIMKFKKFAFKDDKVGNNHIFKIPELTKGYIFVSDVLKNRILQSKIAGIGFEEVWNSEK